MEKHRPPALIIPEVADAREAAIEGAFLRWVALGEGRSFQALGKEVGIPARELIAHATRFRWAQRLGIMVARASERTMDKMVTSLAEVNERHVTALREMQLKALDTLRTVVIDKPADAIRLLTQAIQLERQVLGVDQGQEKDLAEVLSEKIKQLHQVPETTGKPVLEFQTLDDDEVNGDLA